MNAKLEVLFMEFPTRANSPYVILKRWSLTGENPVSDVIVEWGVLDNNGLLAERYLLCLDAFLPNDELIAIAKTKLPVVR